MSKFIKIIIDRNKKEYKNIQYLPAVILLYKQFSGYLYDDYFTKSNSSDIDSVIALIERTSPYFWVIVDKKTSQFAGFVFLDNWVGAKNDFHSAEVTTCFERKFWGKYTKICAKRFVKYCFKNFGLKKLKASVFSHNHKVRNLLKRTGFKREAVLNSETIKNGHFQNIELFSILKDDYKL